MSAARMEAMEMEQEELAEGIRDGGGGGCGGPDDEDDDDSGSGWQEMGFCSKAEYFVRNITVEPLLALFQVSSVLSNLTTQNLNLQKACRVNLKLDDHVCYGLEDKNMSSLYADQEVQVQQMVADMLVWQTVVQSSVPCVLVVFIGSWSDRHRKRKPCMLVPVVGELVRNFGLLLCVHYFHQLPMEVAGLVESIPNSVTGGLTVLYMSAFSYIGDISSIKNRTLRVGLMNLFFGASWPIGAALSGILYQQFGFYGVYYISSALYFAAIIYGLLRIRDHDNPVGTKEHSQTSKSCMSFVNDFFDLKHIKEALNVTFKKGPRKRWLQLTMLVFTIVVVQGPMQGEYAIAYLYARLRFQWNEVDYSIFSTFQSILNILGVGITVGILSHLFKMDDTKIGMIACLSKVFSGFVFAFAPSKFYFYMGAVFDTMSSASYIVVRSIVSKTVPHAELGQVSAVLAVVETLVPVVYKPMYSAIYRATVNTFPGTFYVIGSVMLMPSVFLYWWMYRINKYEDKKKSVAEREVLNK